MAVRTKGNVPVKKVKAGGLGGAFVTIVVVVLNSYVLPEDKPLTGEFAAALTMICSWVIAYFTSPGAKEEVIEV